MAYIEKRKRKKGLVYIAYIRLKGYPAEVRSFDKYSDAVVWAEEREHQIKNGIPAEGKVAPGDMELGKATDKFIESATDKSKNTVNDYRFAQTQLLLYFGEKKLLSEITTPDVSQFIAKRMGQDGVGPSKMRAELTLIRLVYQKAAEWGVNLRSPEESIPRPKHRRKSREDELDRVIKPDEMIALLNESKNRPNYLYWFLLFLLYTGMRPSEAAALHWKRLPAEKEKELILQRKHVGYVDIERGGFSRIGTKTETRFVPAHPIALDIIAQLDNNNKYVFIPDRDEQPDRPYTFFRRTFETSRTKAKIDSNQIRQDIDFYSFRHTARSRMAASGMQDSAAEMIIGHADKEMQRTYTHYDDEGLITEISKLNYPWLSINTG